MLLYHKKELKEKLLSRMEIKPSPDNRYQDCWWYLNDQNFDGYGNIVVQCKRRSVHRLAAYLWLDFDLNSLLKVCHKCDNRICFNPEHLFIGTDQDNANDMVSKGRQAKEFRVRGRTKLSDKEVEQLKFMRQNTKFSYKELGQMFGITLTHTFYIISGRRRKS